MSTAPGFKVTVNDASETRIIDNTPPAAVQASQEAAPAPKNEKGGK